MSFGLNENPTFGFCALEYRPQDAGSLSSDDNATRILLLMEKKGGSLELRVRRQWIELVQPADREYVTAILSDFKERATLDPDTLLEQASKLAVGPLITHATGSTLTENPKLLILWDTFVEP